MTVVGYSESGQNFMVMNSCGRGGRESGFGGVGDDSFPQAGEIWLRDAG